MRGSVRRQAWCVIISALASCLRVSADDAARAQNGIPNWSFKWKVQAGKQILNLCILVGPHEIFHIRNGCLHHGSRCRPLIPSSNKWQNTHHMPLVQLRIIWLRGIPGLWHHYHLCDLCQPGNDRRVQRRPRCGILAQDTFRYLLYLKGVCTCRLVFGTYVYTGMPAGSLPWWERVCYL